MDLMAMAMALKAKKMNAAEFKAAVEQYLEDNPGAVDQAALEAILDGRLDGIEEDLGGIKSAVTSIDETVNGVISYNYTEGKKITANNSGYSIDDDADSCVSELIEITWDWDTSTNVRFYYNSTADNYFYKIIYFDENMNYLGYKGSYGDNYRSVTSVAGAKYVRFSFKQGTTGKLMQNLAPQTVYWEASGSVSSSGLVQKLGDLNNLGTTAKSSAVGAINEVNDRVTSVENAVNGKVDKNGSKQVTVENCQFMVYSPNLFDETELTIGLLNKNSGDILTNYTDFRTSDWIEVDSSENYIFSCSNSNGFTLYLCWYKSDKTYISGEQTSISPTLLKTAPSNAKYIRFSVNNTHLEYKIQFEKGSTATDYMKYGEGYLMPEYAPVINEDFILNLPAKVYALAGTEMNIYFDNLVEGYDTDYEWDVTCSTQSIGMHLERGYRITASETGTYTLTFTAKRKSDGSTVTKSTSLIIVGTSAGSGDSASVIILGDSTTDNGIAVSKIHENFENYGMTVSTLGTRGTAPNNHEGRFGWRFSFYFTKASETYTDGRGTIYNPFYNPTTQTFDADYYFANSGIAKPDYFIINLGINDMFGANSDFQMDAAIENTIDYCDAMVESILAATTTTKVCVCFTIPPNYSQDAFGREYKTGQNRNRYKKNNVHWVQRLMEEYEGRENERIYVIPINLALDTRYNMGFDTQPVNARNTDITYQMPIGNGGVHPVTSGYWQIADVYTAFLKGNAE